MKKQERKIETNSNSTEETNWTVIGPILAIILASVIWAMFF